MNQLEVEGLFSFGHESNRLDLRLNEGLTVIVGPNAVGKTNVGRSISLLQSVLRSKDSFNLNEDRNLVFERLNESIRYGRNESTPPEARSSIGLSVNFDSEEERHILVLFVRSLVISGILGRMGGQPPGDALRTIEAWVAENVTTESVTPLFSGSIVASHSGVVGTLWDVIYEFDFNGSQLTWHIDSPSINLRNSVAARTTDTLQNAPNDSLDQRMSMRGGVPSVEQSPPDFDYSFSLLTPGASGPVSVGMVAMNYAIQPAPIREYLEEMGVAADAKGVEVGRRTFDLASPLAKLLHRGIWYLGGEDGSLQLPDGGVDSYRAASGDGAVQHAEPIATIALRLFRLKNGSQRHQKRYQEIQELFTRLAIGRRFEVRYARNRNGEDEVTIEIFKSQDQDSGTPLEFAGTGVFQALNIAETLGGNPSRLLFLDEPAANLHPTWQRIVLSKLCGRTDQSLLITHSPYLVPTDSKEHLASIVRFGEFKGYTRQFRLSEADLDDKAIIEPLIRDLSISGDARGLLFASAVILLEGETELGAIPIWCSKSACSELKGKPDDLNITFFSVGGDKSFRAYLTYLNRFGIPWAIICDGAAFRLDASSHILEQIIKSGFVSASLTTFLEEKIRGRSQDSMDASLFDEMVEAGRSGRIFTLASGWHRAKDPEGDDESFESYVERDETLKVIASKAAEEFPRSKPRMGRLIAESSDCPKRVNDIYEDILKALLEDENFVALEGETAGPAEKS